MAAESMQSMSSQKRRLKRKKTQKDPEFERLDSLPWNSSIPIDDTLSAFIGSNDLEGGFLSLEEIDEAEYGLVIPEPDTMKHKLIPKASGNSRKEEQNNADFCGDASRGSNDSIDKEAVGHNVNTKTSKKGKKEKKKKKKKKVILEVPTTEEAVAKDIESYLCCFYGERPKEWVRWLPWAKYWYNTTYQRTLGVTPFQGVYGRLPPPLIYYGDREASNSTLDEGLKERDVALEALKEHLQIAQEKMKKYTDLKRRDVEYQAGDTVFLKIRQYRQVSLRKKRNKKLSPKFFGPYKIIEKIGPIAYKLELPSTSHPFTQFFM
ncbi:DEAD-box ATP-dependent RNA helicase 13 [Cucumis melo var. makuwa]|uniref:DEAD-box ATP-dependent RNA helicase 13 n=1 Tax=Cucumis melo var. makuwa TaxID=1194695 RepID=A0A5D3CYA0_CUCMM|nr:DEAD-box ATP-dependent RNA helicase 13 [Cucumis melo var. makuwa]